MLPTAYFRAKPLSRHSRAKLIRLFDSIIESKFAQGALEFLYFLNGQAAFNFAIYPHCVLSVT